MGLGIKTGFIAKHKALFFALFGVGIALLILTLPAFLRLVEFLGHRIEQEDIELDYIKGLGWAIFLGLTILIWPVRSHDKKALLWIWSVKCFLMLGLMLFYEYHYQTDAFGYFSQGKQDIGVWEALCSAGLSNLPVTFITLLHHHSFLDSFHATKVSFGMIGLVAIYIFYRSVAAFLRQENLRLLYIFAFFPSILFWSSIYGKDPVVFFTIAVYCYGVIRWIRMESFPSAIIVLSGILFAASIRSWLGPILSLPVFVIVIRNIFLKNIRTRVVFLLTLVLMILFFSNRLVMRFGFESTKDFLPRAANQQFIGFARGGSMTAKEPPTLAPSIENRKKFNGLKDIIFYIPQGVFTVLFRPLPGEVNNVFGFLAGLEDAFLLILFGLAIKRMQWQRLSDPVCIWAILLIVIWAALYGFIGYNMGTICRYRLQILPIFLGLLLYLVHGSNKRGEMI